MGAVLQRIDDPRDKLDRALPDEIYFWGRKNGVMELQRHMPKTEMMRIMRERGLVDIPIPNRILGQPIDWRNEWSQGRTTEPPAAITAEQLARQQWEEQNNSKPVEPRKNAVAELLVDQMSIQQLRRECRARNIKLSRTDNLATLREKLRAV